MCVCGFGIYVCELSLSDERVTEAYHVPCRRVPSPCSVNSRSKARKRLRSVTMLASIATSKSKAKVSLTKDEGRAGGILPDPESTKRKAFAKSDVCANESGALACVSVD